MRILISIYLLLSTSRAIAQTEYAKGTFEKSKIHNYCDSLYKAGLFNGNILIADKGYVVYKASFGKANEKTGQALNENSIFELASLSKQFTAMAVVILKEKGKLSFDAEIGKFLPELSFYKKVTIRNLLNHTGGLPDYMALMDTTFNKSKIATNNDVISSFVKYKPKKNFEPNTKYEYSNTGYALLATIIERVSGQTYADFLQENIFKPLNMKNSLVYCRRKSPKNLSNYAYGYIYMPHLKRNVIPDSFPEFKVVRWLDGVVGDGAVNSTVIDLLAWDRALYTEKLCSKESLKEIFSPSTLSDKTKSDYGFGWVLENNYYKKIVSHQGGWPGYTTYIDRHIESDKTIIVLQNVDHIDEPQISMTRLRNMLHADSLIKKPVNDSLKVPVEKLVDISGIERGIFYHISYNGGPRKDEINQTLFWYTHYELPAKTHFVIEHFCCNKWAQRGKVSGKGRPGTGNYAGKEPGKYQYKFKVPAHSGENRWRVLLMNDSNVCLAVSKELRAVNNKGEPTIFTAKVDYTLKKKTKEICFSDETYYELYDAAGILVDGGRGKKISYSALEKGTYTLNYDNSTATVKLN